MNTTRNLSEELIHAGYVPGMTYEQCLDIGKHNLAMQAVMKAIYGPNGPNLFVLMAELADRTANFWEETGENMLREAGYIPGQTYAQCVEMAKWHPGMSTLLKTIDDKQFGYAVAVLAEKSIKPADLLTHNVVLGRTRDGLRAPQKECAAINPENVRIFVNEISETVLSMYRAAGFHITMTQEAAAELQCLAAQGNEKAVLVLCNVRIEGEWPPC